MLTFCLIFFTLIKNLKTFKENKSTFLEKMYYLIQLVLEEFSK